LKQNLIQVNYNECLIMYLLIHYLLFLGFIGKGMTRHLNRVWNYVIKGILGTLAMLIIFPIICLSVSFGSLVIALTGPLW